jgi:signal transduction histidine kinase
MMAMSDVASLMAAPYGHKGVKLHLGSADVAINALGDADRLRQVLLNLLSNAVKFTPAGGTVSLSGHVEGPIVHVTCRDSGRGIPADKLEAIFEPFVQVDRYAGERQGTGLGLAISRDLARGMRGDLTVRSELGRGSVFTVRLPKA